MNPALALLQEQFPDYQIWDELVRDRTRYVARATIAGARPHTVVTPDLAELELALQHGATAAQPSRPATARTTPEPDLTGKETLEMPARNSKPAPADPEGQVARISVTYNVNTSGGVRHTFHSLQAMNRYAPPDRVQELLRTLTEICEDVLAGRGHSVFGLPKDTVRQPFGSAARAS
jgi:hypothetical protein